MVPIFSPVAADSIILCTQGRRARSVLYSLTRASPEIDSGNYSTDIASGASYRFHLLFIVLLSNLFSTMAIGHSMQLRI